MQSRLKIQLSIPIICALIFHSAWAQVENKARNNFYTDNLGVDDGLSQSNVYSIFKDHEGFIWIGTDNGLNRFDGYDCKTFFHNPNDSLSISDDKIWMLFEDSQQRFWIGTNIGGLNLFDRKTHTFKSYIHDDKNENSISNNTVLTIFEDSHNRLWAGTLWGLNLYEPETDSFRHFYQYDEDGGIANNEIQGIGEKNGYLWVATKNGLSLINVEDFSVRNLLQNRNDYINFINNRLECLLIDSKGTIWVGTNGAGLVRYNEEKNTFDQFLIQKKDDNKTKHIILSLLEDKNGQLIVGTDGGGLYYFDPSTEKFQQIHSKNDRSFDNSAIYGLYLDNDDILWTGRYGSGVTIINRKSKGFEHYEYFNETMLKFGKNSVLTLAEDRQKNIWIGTDGAGLYKYNPADQSFTTYIHDPNDDNSISGNVVKSLLVDDKGNLYVGTYAAGLNYIDLTNNKVTKYSPDENDSTTLQTEHVWDIYQDSQGRIWVGQLRGFCEFLPKEKKFIRYSLNVFNPNSLGSTNITKIYEDKSNNLWVGTQEGGLGILDRDTKKFKRYQHSEDNIIGLSNNDVKEIFEDHTGKLWVGTNGGGLNYYDEELDEFVWLKSNSDLPYEIMSVLEDKSNNFWIGTLDGLVKYNPAADIVKFYTKSDGIQGNEFNYDAKLLSSDGTFYFGGLNGLNYFKPENITDNTKTPAIALSELYLFHSPVLINDKSGILSQDINTLESITIQEHQNVVTFWYSALDYNFPKKNKYAYRLEGFDDDWNYVDDIRSATYTNLPPGNFTFRVIASNNEGYWNEKGKSIQVIVKPPWYKVPWVVILFLIMLTLILVAFFRIRTRMFEVQKRRLELEVRKRTLQIELQKKELLKQNQKISSQNEELINKNEEIEAQRSQIEEKSHLLLKAHGELKLANNELKKANTELEKVVDKRTEELRITIQQLIKTDEELSTFLYRSSHDLRGPIVTLIGLSQLAKMEVNDEQSKNYFEKINKSCSHMLHFLKQLNDTNVIFRSLKVNNKLNWTKIITDVKNELQNIDPENRVRKELDIQINQFLYSDELMVKTIIQNLMENSILYHRRTDPFVKLTLRYKNRTLIISIMDNGIGIDPSIQEKIFDMFFRGSEASKGNGLGLYLVQKAVDVLEGDIELKSKTMEFTEFIVKIPIEKTEKKDHSDVIKELPKIFADKI